MGESLDRGRLVPVESTEASINLERSDVPPKYGLSTRRASGIGVFSQSGRRILPAIVSGLGILLS